MSNVNKLENIKAKIREEVCSELEKEDSWLIITLEYSEDGKLCLSPDSRFIEFKDKREVRGLYWGALEDAIKYKEIGYGFVVAGVNGMSVLAQLIKSEKPPKGIVAHRTVVDKYFPKLSKPTAVLNSVDGFLDPSDPNNKSKAAPRPGSVTRKNMKEGVSCYYCPSTDELTLHHLIRRELGGATEPENLLVVCRPCHDLIHEGHIDDSELVMAVYAKRADRIANKIKSSDEKA